MSDAISDPFENSNKSDANDWQTVFLMLPRVAHFITRFGMRRTLLMPGRYEVRRSRSLNARVYRAKR